MLNTLGCERVHLCSFDCSDNAHAHNNLLSCFVAFCHSLNDTKGCWPLTHQNHPHFLSVGGRVQNWDQQFCGDNSMSCSTSPTVYAQPQARTWQQQQPPVAVCERQQQVICHVNSILPREDKTNGLCVAVTLLMRSC